MYTLFTHTHTHTHTRTSTETHTQTCRSQAYLHKQNARTLATELPLYINTTLLLAVSALASVLVYIHSYL